MCLYFCVDFHYFEDIHVTETGKDTIHTLYKLCGNIFFFNTLFFFLNAIRPPAFIFPIQALGALLYYFSIGTA